MNLSELGFFRISTVSPAVRVGDVDFNLSAITQAYHEQRLRGVQVVVFPELALVGYTCGDLLLHDTLLHAAEHALYELVAFVQAEHGLLVVGMPIRAWGRLYNCAVAISSSGISAIIPKQFITNYGEYYEQRWFTRPLGDEPPFVTIGHQHVPFGTDLLLEATIESISITIGVEICEDLWAVKSPSQDLALAGAEILVNLSASNEILTKSEYRRDLVRMHSARCLAAYAYTSAGSGESTTDTVYSGHMIIAENGVILSEDRAFSFETRWICVDVDIDRLRYDRRRMVTFGQHQVYSFRRVRLELPLLTDKKPLRQYSPMPFVPDESVHRASRCREVLTIQKTALAKRLKYTGISSVVLGISGGLDSTLALLVCCEAFDLLNIDRHCIHAIIMPGPGSSQRTQEQAHRLASTLGADVHVVPITEAVQQHLTALGHDMSVQDILFENAQARERTQVLMDLCHKYNALMVGTSDLSEIALGWTTYGGDHMSMYNINAGVPKTLVRYIIEWWAQTTTQKIEQEMLRTILATPISPELLPPNPDGSIRQHTEDVLGPYIVHDFFLYGFLRYGYSPKKLHAIACWAFEGIYESHQLAKWLQTFFQRFYTNQFKRSCMPDGPKVGTIALSPRCDWRMPSDAEFVLWIQAL